MVSTSPSQTARPNILLVTVDQWRGDCLGFAGHPVVETPHLDQLFYHGVNFSRAYAAVPTCVAARTSIMTGLGQRSHGRVGYADGLPWNFEVTLPRLLRDAGYHTYCVGKLHVSPERNRIGFDHVVLHDGWLLKHSAAQNYDLYDDHRVYLRRHTHADADVRDTGLHVNSLVVNPWPHDERHHPTNWAVSEAIDFLRRRDPTQPFFLNLSLVRPHPPFDPPEKYLEFYRGKPLPPVPVGEWRIGDDLGQAALNPEWTRGEVKPAQLDRTRRAYYALITQIDLQLNRLFLALDEHELQQNTVILFVSDHGELLGDHHYHSKALPFEGSARVPWLMRFPTSWGIAPRRTIDAPVELRDILPTLCECAGVAVPGSVEGRSVLPLCRGERVAWREALHGEHVRGGGESTQWLTDGRTKYIWFSETGRELLFDLELDPQEMRNLAPHEGERLSLWRARLVEVLQDFEEGFVVDGELVPGRPQQSVLQHAKGLDTPC